jgi:nicotinate-nucleotide pyrophosphorylase (carboxylating)
MTTNHITAPLDVEATVRQALAEDIGDGDLTAQLIPAEAQAEAEVITREDAVLCGQPWFDEVFHQIDPAIRINWRARDGDTIRVGDIICELAGPARGVLTGERTALNFLQMLSGTATHARRYVDAVRGTQAVILDTRKTLPGLRSAQKYAVRRGGGHNHRMGLYDAILIKENHVAAAGSIAKALQTAKASASTGVPVEIEIENLNQWREAIQAGADHLLLDNFTLNDLKAAVNENQGRAKLEASGGVTLDNVRAVAETGVDFISIGDMTKNIRAIDLSLRLR